MPDDELRTDQRPDETDAPATLRRESLPQSAEPFRLMVEAVKDYAIFMLDPRGRVASWNAGAERFKGYRAEEIVGEHFSRFYTPEDIEAGKPEWELKIAAAEGRYEEEGWRVRKDGTRFWANVVITAVKDGGGILRGFAKVTRDVTERKMAEEERARLLAREREARAEAERAAGQLRNLQTVADAALAHLSLDDLLGELLNRVRAILDADTVAILLVTEGGEHLAVRAALGLEEEVPRGVLIPVGRGIAGRIAARREPVVVDDLSAVEVVSPVLREKGVQSLLGVPLLVEGRLVGVLHVGSLHRRRFTEDEAQLLQLAGDRAALAIEHARWYEAERRARATLEQRVAERTAELQEVNAELESFAYTISHDLRAPLRALQGFTEALLEDYAGRLDETGQEYARRTAAAARRMDTLIQDLLAYSRLSRAGIEVRRVRLAEVVEDVLSHLESELLGRGAQVTVEGPLPDVIGHRPTLTQVVTNLVTNAVKFVEREVRPRVRVWAEEDSGRVRLYVEDNGIGIAPEYQERVFRVFERLHGIETYPGTGIGLAIVRKGVERMGGRAGVESAVGRGSRFWVELPKAENE